LLAVLYDCEIPPLVLTDGPENRVLKRIHLQKLYEMTGGLWSTHSKDLNFSPNFIPNSFKTLKVAGRLALLRENRKSYRVW
jgi:hypothetical protein